MHCLFPTHSSGRRAQIDWPPSFVRAVVFMMPFGKQNQVALRFQKPVGKYFTSFGASFFFKYCNIRCVFIIY